VIVSLKIARIICFIGMHIACSDNEEISITRKERAYPFSIILKILNESATNHVAWKMQMIHHHSKYKELK